MNIQNHYTIEQQWIILPLSITLSQTSYIFNIKMIANIPQTPNRIVFVVSLKIVWSLFSNLFVAYILSWSFFLILVIRGRLLSISNTGIFLAGLFVFRVFLFIFLCFFLGGGVITLKTIANLVYLWKSWMWLLWNLECLLNLT